MHAIDWTMVVAVFAVAISSAWYFRRYMRGVSDFMAASRMAGSYMLTIAPGICGATGFILSFEASYNNGISSGWWATLGMPVSIMLTLFGFVQYRLRQTRALTLSQFLEERYSRKFRMFAGILCWCSGVLNYGIFPMITARCIMGFFRLPTSIVIQEMSIGTYPLVMAAMLFTACFIACVGGQVCILLTGFIMNLVVLCFLFVIMWFFLCKFGWNTVADGLINGATSQGQSMVNPFEAFDADGFNIWYFVILLAFNSYSRGCWQGGGGFNAAAKTPHDSLMSGILNRWKSYSAFLTASFIPLAAYAMLNMPQYAAEYAEVKAHLASITDMSTLSQMRVPLFLAHVLPAGFFGMFAVIVLAGAISTDDSYLHSWGTILIQDIVMPIRKKAFEPKTHLLLLRLSIIGIALFSFLFSCWFPLKDFVGMYFMVTGAIYMGGAGAVVIGGLYWKRGSTPAAWTAMILGTIICLGGVLLQSFWPQVWPILHGWFPNWQYLTANQTKFPIPSPIVTLMTMATAIGSYALVSLLGPKHVHNMDQLLHRGKYAVAGEAPIAKPKFTWARLFGISPEHTPIERFLVYFSFWFTMGEWLIFAVVTILALTTNWLDGGKFWTDLHFWRHIVPYAAFGSIASIWLACGGLRDAVQLVRDLKNFKRNEDDNGFVKGDDTELSTMKETK
ncbi:MAG: hypothetical protein MJ025_00830 [Victivallaceae bacterium]|nr:hypothetical protein [Victivallaceae bacterium]